MVNPERDGHKELLEMLLISNQLFHLSNVGNVRIFVCWFCFGVKGIFYFLAGLIDELFGLLFSIAC